MVVKRVDIRDWKSPVSKQYGIRSIPYLVLYDDQGQRVSTDSNEVLVRFERLP